MRIAYIYLLMKDSSVGVVRKAEQQAEALGLMGESQMDVIVLNPDIHEVSGQLHKRKIRFVLPGPLGLVEFLFFKRQLIERSVDLSGYDKIILRYSSSDRSLQKLFRKKDCIAELQTMIIEELEAKISTSPFSVSSLARRIRLLMERRYLVANLAECKGMITVGHHLAAYYSSKLGTPLPIRVITNGYTGLKRENVGFKPFDGKELNLIFVGSRPDVWHGLDRLVGAVLDYWKRGGPIKVKVHFVGSFSATNIPGTEKYPGSFVFYGKRSREEINALIPEMNLAVAPLALHRKGLDDTSAIKTVEYTFKGLPFIISYPDSGFDEVEAARSFILRVSDDDGIFDFDKVVSFARRMTESRTETLDYMKTYAERHLTWQVKMREYIEFVENSTI